MSKFEKQIETTTENSYHIYYFVVVLLDMTERQIVNEAFWSISLARQSGIVLEQNFSLFVNRLIEAQETTREIRKLNQIMKTKDARIENLETK